jgi:hypothetical protein
LSTLLCQKWIHYNKLFNTLDVSEGDYISVISKSNIIKSVILDALTWLKLFRQKSQTTVNTRHDVVKICKTLLRNENERGLQSTTSGGKARQCYLFNTA